MKKKIFSAVILVLVFAGSALAAPCIGRTNNNGMGQGINMGYARMTDQNMTAEQKAKVEEMHRLNMDIRAELQKATPNKAKAREMHNQLQKLKVEMETVCFEEVMKNPAKYTQTPKGQKRGMSSFNKANIDEVRSLQGQIMAEFQKEVPNKAKIRELHEKLQTVKKNRDDQRLEYMLKNPEAFKDGRGFGKNLKPVNVQQ